jgi:hypothetical protein
MRNCKLTRRVMALKFIGDFSNLALMPRGYEMPPLCGWLMALA